MSLGAGAYKVGEKGQCSSTRRYPWQPCERPLQGTVTLNYSVEYLPPNTYLTLRHRGRESWEKYSTKMESKQQGYSKEVPLLRASPPSPSSIVGKTADQHWFEDNFA